MREFRKLVDDITTIIDEPRNRTIRSDSAEVEAAENRRRLQEREERNKERERVRERQRPAEPIADMRAKPHGRKPNKPLVYSGLAAVLILAVSAIIWRFSQSPTQPESVPGEQQQTTPVTRTALQMSFDWGADNKTLQGAVILGSDLGAVPGKVNMTLTYRNEQGQQVRSNPIALDAQLIKEWKPGKIELAFTKAMQGKFDAIWNDFYKRLPDGNARGVQFQIVTSDGRILNSF